MPLLMTKFTMVYPSVPSGYSLEEFRRGVANVTPQDGTQARRRRRDTFRTHLEQWVQSGGRCDLLRLDMLENSPVSRFTPELRSMALSHSRDDPPHFITPPSRASEYEQIIRSSAPTDVQYSPSEDGFCYLVAVRSDARNQAADALGFNPWRPAVLAWLLDHPSVHSGDKFNASLGGVRIGSGNHVQMHLEVSNGPGALTWTEALSLGPASTRVGGYVPLLKGLPAAAPPPPFKTVSGSFPAPEPRSLPPQPVTRAGDELPDAVGDEPSDRPVAGQQFPTNLPDPKHHPVILVDGLHVWFQSLSSEYARIFLRYLFRFDPDQQSPAPGLFLQPLSTYRLAAVYDMSPWSARDNFSLHVTWRGVEDETLPPRSDGYCYLPLLEPSERAAAARMLGPKPDSGGVCQYKPNPTGRFRVELTGPALYHVTSASRGLTAAEVMQVLPPGSRVGAATGDKLAILTEAGQSSLAAGPRSAFDIVPTGPRTSLTLAMYATLDKGTHTATISWSPLTQPAFVVMLAVYESVRLESAEFSISVAAGQGNSCWCAVANASVPAPSANEWYGCPVLKVVDGSDDGTVVSSFELPPQHSFSKELRAALPGNDPPRFHFGYVGAAGGNAVVMGRFVVSVSGQKPMGAFDANPAKAPKVTREMRRLMATLPPVHPSVCSMAEEDAESSDDEDEDDEPGPSSGTTRSPPNRA